MNILVLLILLGICSITLSQEKEKKKKNRYYGCAAGDESCLRVYTRKSFVAAKERMQKMNIALYQDKEECKKACKKS
ncbi:unnamed protein product [Cylicocyclus nassatus]|uniref:Uncharacterized protein n=1 Tax=Cylicocyclus nassatus TaxID=53992 RepID=A0AA36GR38_CYLNA|nr:unnamed protein product [Cylicocyclus nassatus]